MNIEQIRAAAEAELPLLKDPTCIEICVSSMASDHAAASISSLIENAIDRKGLHAKVVRTGSLGLYDLDPTVAIKRRDRDDILYANVAPGQIDDLLSDIIADKREAPKISEVPALKKQMRVALRNCGWIDPDDIHYYIGHAQGYSGLANALMMDPPYLLANLIPFALKGRGGPGCSAWDQWRSFPKAGNREGYLICNAVDPDPRAKVSRLLLDSDPHSILEGLLIGAYAVGASRCLCYIEEGTAAGRRLQKALDSMKAYNLLGSNILDSQFCLDMQIKEVPGSLASGGMIELFRCAEEKQAAPHMLPAFPDASEFMGKPVLFVNPESMSSLAAALLEREVVETASRVVTLSGDVLHSCTVEVSQGTTIRSVIEFFGDGVSVGKRIKAIQYGGPTGPWIAPDALDFSIDCDATEETRSSIGSGTIHVLDNDSRMVDITKELMSYIQTHSCGKCVFCREGCLQMLTILEEISENKGRPQDLQLLVELGEEMKVACLCEFGRSAPNPVLSSIRLFPEEYEQ